MKPVQYETINKRVITPPAKMKISQDLENQNWSAVLEAEDINKKVELFHSTVKAIFEKHCPIRRYRKAKNKPCLETPLTRKLWRAKQRSHQKNSKTVWKYLNKTLHKQLKKLRRKYAENNINKIMTDSRRWWENVKSLTNSSHHSNSHPIFINDEWLTPFDFANQLNTYYTTRSDETVLELPALNKDSCRIRYDVTYCDVVKLLKAINTRKATHTEDFPQWISKLNPEAIAIPLHDIIQQMFNTGKFPALWKSSEITPLNKISSPETFKDFRPISLLHHCSKIAEAFIIKHLQSYNITDSDQYAYTKGVGTTDALVNIVTSWKLTMDHRQTLAIYALFEDFSKAFDSMRPDALAAIMISQGYEHATIKLCIDYLTNRTQRVIHKHSGVKSPIRVSSIGVPQGTKCGPMLWNIFIKSLVQTEQVIKYADDITVYTTIDKRQSETISRGTKSTSSNTIANQAKL
jgi:hypothetical protein